MSAGMPPPDRFTPLRFILTFAIAGLILAGTMVALAPDALATNGHFCAGDRVYSPIIDQFGTVGDELVTFDNGRWEDLDFARVNFRLQDCTVDSLPSGP